MNYREVKCSERLPKKEWDNGLSDNVILLDNSAFIACAAYSHKLNVWIKPDGSILDIIFLNPTHWLEPVTEPSKLKGALEMLLTECVDVDGDSFLPSSANIAIQQAVDKRG